MAGVTVSCWRVLHSNVTLSLHAARGVVPGALANAAQPKNRSASPTRVLKNPSCLGEATLLQVPRAISGWNTIPTTASYYQCPTTQRLIAIGEPLPSPETRWAHECPAAQQYSGKHPSSRQRAIWYPAAQRKWSGCGARGPRGAGPHRRVRRLVGRSNHYFNRSGSSQCAHAWLARPAVTSWSQQHLSAKFCCAWDVMTPRIAQGIEAHWPGCTCGRSRWRPE